MRKASKKHNKSSILEGSKGITIIELVVAMTIFLIVVTLAVGVFVTLLRFQSQSETMTDVQQNGRISIEQITRLLRQADKVAVGHISGTPVHTDHVTASDHIDTLEVTIGTETKCFGVAADEGLKIAGTCAGINSGLSLTSDGVKVKRFYFTQIAGIPSRVNIFMSVESKDPTVAGDINSKDRLNLDTSVLLTGLK